MSRADVVFQLQSGIAYQRAGCFTDAARICQDILSSHPNDFDATYLLAMLHAQQGAISQAVESFKRAVRLKPHFVDARYNLAVAMTLAEDHEGALKHYQRALKLDPTRIDAINNYASTLAKLGRFPDAVQQCRRLVALKPDHAEGHCNLSIMLTELGLFDEAVESAERAIAICPEYAEAHFSRGVALMDRLEEALSSYDRAIELKPDYAEAFGNRGIVLQELNRFAAAMESYDKAIALKPDYAEAHRNRYMLLLLQGDFGRGWVEMARWKKRGPRRSIQFDGPVWLGSPDIAGKTVLVHWEQGLGDTIQFSRFVPLIMKLGANVLFLSPRSLRALMSSLSGKPQLIDEGRALPEYDCHCSLMSLPAAFGTSFDSIPRDVPYLSAEPDRVAKWGQVIGPTGFRIEIAWHGSPDSRQLGKAIPLLLFERLSTLPEVRLISLQKNQGSEQLGKLPAGMKVETLGEKFDAGQDAFLDTAAIMKNLDLVITIDTSIAHLAGAVGAPTWVALQHVPDWRWMTGRSDSPWYPSIRLFRQKARGDWQGVLASIETALTEEIASRRDRPGAAV